MRKFDNINVDNTFMEYPSLYRKRLLELRDLIFETGDRIDKTNKIEESLKWGQPSYTCKGASPIRIDRFEKDKIAMFFHCQTTLVETFRKLFTNDLTFSKNRAIVLEPKKELPVEELKICIEMALTYHKKN
ncbi:DUF1801 domain-containing protein [Breznakia pachnodae]|uniref:YdhG-like domain-containing protein n=1 Tax=Breznakia pachnodae TaxID=265178 RepID=A0ABU0E543_9FIRM|nr:DUF1801 domain-containing protein [Breznakia pachnodae]MDQ0362022.1 hypothetical protein [Breznakia pachnodae]